MSDAPPASAALSGALFARRLIAKAKDRLPDDDPRDPVARKLRRWCNLDTPELAPALTRVRTYEPRWRELFASERQRLTDELGAGGLGPGVGLHQILHIGSSAIPGLDGKPIIDMLVAVDSAPDMTRAADRLADLDYAACGLSPCDPEATWSWRVVGDDHAFVVHLCERANPWIPTAVNFCAYMRAHPQERDAYERRKHELADRELSLLEYSVEKLITFGEFSARANQWAARQ